MLCLLEKPYWYLERARKLCVGCMTDPRKPLINQLKPLSASNLAHFTLLCGWLSEFASQSMLHAVRQATLSCVLPVLPGGFGQSRSEGLRRCRPISPQWCQPGQAEAPCRGRPPLCPPRAGASRLVGGSDGAIVFCAFFFRRFLGLSRPLRFLTAALL